MVLSWLSYFLEKVVPGPFTVYCAIHYHHLVAKDMSCKHRNILSIFINSVNKIKAHTLNSQLNTHVKPTFMAKLQFIKFWMGNPNFKGHRQFSNLRASDDETPISDASL